VKQIWIKKEDPKGGILRRLIIIKPRRNPGGASFLMGGHVPTRTCDDEACGAKEEERSSLLQPIQV
jgi:hypothetical protein